MEVDKFPNSQFYEDDICMKLFGNSFKVANNIKNYFYAFNFTIFSMF